MDVSPTADPIAVRRLPSGTVTFLFSDIEGSTQRWERDRTAMQAAVQRHDALMRAAMERHGGFVFKTVGDAFCVAFHTVPDAIDAALDAQRGLVAENWDAVGGLRVRTAMHTGLADERDGDYFGPTVNRVARLLAIGHGGQTLVSGIAADLGQGLLPALTSLHDLGPHRLKDLAFPEQVYQLNADGLPADFPPLRSLDTFTHNLPQQLTTFVGRDDELRLALGAARRGRTADAARLLGFVDAQVASRTLALDYTEVLTRRRIVEELDRAFSDSAYDQLLREGAEMSEDDAIAAALAATA